MGTAGLEGDGDRTPAVPAVWAPPARLLGACPYWTHATSAGFGQRTAGRRVPSHRLAPELHADVLVTDTATRPGGRCAGRLLPWARLLRGLHMDGSLVLPPGSASPAAQPFLSDQPTHSSSHQPHLHFAVRTRSLHPYDLFVFPKLENPRKQGPCLYILFNAMSPIFWYVVGI